MEKIPTAESSSWQVQRYVEKLIDSNIEEIPYEGTHINKSNLKTSIVEFLLKHKVEFAKLHVKAALEAAAKKGFIRVDEEFDDEISKNRARNHIDYLLIDEDSILSAYPEDLIK